jgi:adenine-specific DNA-methyltransferase
MDEVFGPKNFVSLITFSKTGGFSAHYIDNVCDFLLWYAKDIERIKYSSLFRLKLSSDESDSKYNSVEQENGHRLPLSQTEVPGKVFRVDTLVSQGYVENLSKPFKFHEEEMPIANNVMKTTMKAFYVS